MSQAAQWFDIVIGVDLHNVMIPTPTGPVALPLPHAFIGYVFDPMGAFSRVAINGVYAATTGAAVRALVKHIPTPPGVAFVAVGADFWE